MANNDDVRVEGGTTWYECVKEDMKMFGLHPEWAVFRDMWRGFMSGNNSGTWTNTS